jgi:hypothetical protein
MLLYLLSTVEEQVVTMYSTEVLYMYMISQDALTIIRLSVIFNKCEDVLNLLLCTCRLNDYRCSVQRLKQF